MRVVPLGLALALSVAGCGFGTVQCDGPQSDPLAEGDSRTIVITTTDDVPDPIDVNDGFYYLSSTDWSDFPEGTRAEVRRTRSGDLELTAPDGASAALNEAVCE